MCIVYIISSIYIYICVCVFIALDNNCDYDNVCVRRISLYYEGICIYIIYTHIILYIFLSIYIYLHIYKYINVCMHTVSRTPNTLDYIIWPTAKWKYTHHVYAHAGSRALKNMLKSFKNGLVDLRGSVEVLYMHTYGLYYIDINIIQM